MCPTRRDAASAHGMPTASPISVSVNVSRRIICKIEPRARLPGATRIPISRVRHETEYEITPKIPVTARISAMAANNPKRVVRNFGWAADASTSAVNSSTSVTGKSLSIWPQHHAESRRPLRRNLRCFFTITAPPQKGDCANGTNIIGPGFWLNATSRIFPTMPTISRSVPESWRKRERHVLSDGILVWKIKFCHCLANYSYARSSHRIMFIEVAPGQQRNSQHAKIIRRHRNVVRRSGSSHGWRRCSHYIERKIHTGADHRCGNNQRGILQPGFSFNSRHQLIREH